MAGCAWWLLPTSCEGPRPRRPVAKAIGDAAFELGWDCDEVPMADGGEGTLDALGGANRSTIVTGPLGAPVDAAWRLDGRTAVIEMAGRLRSGAGRRRRRQRSRGGVDHRHRRADRRGPRCRRAPRHRRVGWIGHHRRRAGRASCPAPARPAEGHRAGRGVRQPCAVPRGGHGLRAPEGRDTGAGGAAASSPRAARPGVPRGARRRRRSRSRAPAPPVGSGGGWRRPAASW